MPTNNGPNTDTSDLAFVPVDPSRYTHLHPCRLCRVWFVTVTRYDHQTDIREWHQKSCPSLAPGSTGS